MGVFYDFQLFIPDFCGEICGLLGWSRYDNPRRNICRWKSELPYYDLKSFMLCWRKTWTYSQLPIFSHGWHVYTQTCSHISRKYLFCERSELHYCTSERSERVILQIFFRILKKYFYFSITNREKIIREKNNSWKTSVKKSLVKNICEKITRETICYISLVRKNGKKSLVKNMINM